MKEKKKIQCLHSTLVDIKYAVKYDVKCVNICLHSTLVDIKF